MMPRLAPAMLMLSALSPALAAPLDDADLDQRIDQLRRADFTLEIVQADGSPVAGPVGYELKRHAFEFGTAIAARMIALPTRSRPARAWRRTPSAGSTRRLRRSISRRR